MILAIDPSNTRHAWALLDGTPSDPILCDFGRDLCALSEWHKMPGEKCVEQIASYGLAAGAHLFDTCVEIGKLMAAWPDAKRLTRIEVKRLVCRSTSARDPHVRQAVIDRFGGPQSIRKGGQLYKVSKDVWAAIAVGLAAMEPDAKWYVPVAERGDQ